MKCSDWDGIAWAKPGDLHESLMHQSGSNYMFLNSCGSGQVFCQAEDWRAPC